MKLIVGDKCMGMLEAVGEVFPDAKYQRCTVHFYRNQNKSRRIPSTYFFVPCTVRSAP